MKLTDKLAQFSARNFLHRPAKEKYFVLMVLLIIGRAFTIGVAIYAGYAYASITLMPFVPNPIALAAISFTALLLLEGMNLYFMSLSIMNLMQGDFKSAVTYVLIASAVGTYTFSYHVSTNGLAMQEARGVDNSSGIISNTSAEKQSVTADYEEQIATLTGQISAIDRSPGGYSYGVKDGSLTPKQQEARAKLVTEQNQLKAAKRAALAKLDEAEKAQLETNTSIMTSTADKYASLVGYIIGSQLVLSLLIAFFHRLNTIEEKREEVVQMVMNRLANEQQQHMDKEDIRMLEDNFNQTRHRMQMSRIYLSDLRKPKQLPNKKKDEHKEEFTESEDVTDTPPSKTDTQPEPEIPATEDVTDTPPSKTETQPEPEPEPVVTQEKERIVVTGLKASKKTSNPDNTPPNNKKREHKALNVSDHNLGKLRKNTALTSYILRKFNGDNNLPVSEICKRTGAKEGRYHEVRNLLIVAGAITEPYKFQQQDGK